MTPAEALSEHVLAAPFALGAARGRWRLVSINFPIALIAVLARDGRWFTLRFDCTGYPAQPPTATLWDTGKNTVLPANMWPTGGRVSKVFNPSWLNCQALYLPCDRKALPGHSQWLKEHPHLIWQPKVGLIQYLSAVWEVLQSHELNACAA